jgi:hypothetical protein
MKRYSILIRPVPNEPFTAQYSYVFTKGSTYSFVLKESSDNAEKLTFTLTNDKGEVLNNELFEVEGMRNTMMLYEAQVTGIYYLNLSSKNSFRGCATLQLSFLREHELFLSDRQQNFRTEFRKRRFGKHETYLKEYLINEGGSRSEYSYILTKGKRYAIYVEGAGNEPSVSLIVKNRLKERVMTEVVSQGKGFFYIITPDNTAIFYFDFLNTSKREIGFARLMELNTVTE